MSSGSDRPGPVTRWLNTAQPEALFVLSAIAQYIGAAIAVLLFDEVEPQTVAWFTSCWGEAQGRMADVLVEVQNNSPRTPPEPQLRLESAALWCCIEGAAADAP